MHPVDTSAIAQQLREEETPEPEPLDGQELQDVWQRGNQRRLLPKTLSDHHKSDLVLLKYRWVRSLCFCSVLHLI